MLLVRAILSAHSRVWNCLDVILWLPFILAFRPLLSKAVNRSPRIYNNKLKFPLFCFFVSPPLYCTHDASCIMLNIDWTPLNHVTGWTETTTVYNWTCCFGSLLSVVNRRHCEYGNSCKTCNNSVCSNHVQGTIMVSRPSRHRLLLSETKIIYITRSKIAYCT